MLTSYSLKDFRHSPFFCMNANGRPAAALRVLLVLNLSSEYFFQIITSYINRYAPHCRLTACYVRFMIPVDGSPFLLWRQFAWDYFSPVYRRVSLYATEMLLMSLSKCLLEFDHCFCKLVPTLGNRQEMGQIPFNSTLVVKEKGFQRTLLFDVF